MGSFKEFFNPGSRDRSAARNAFGQGFLRQTDIYGPGGISSGFRFGPEGTRSTSSLGSFDPFLGMLQGSAMDYFGMSQAGLPDYLLDAYSKVPKWQDADFSQGLDSLTFEGLGDLFTQSKATADKSAMELGAELSKMFKERATLANQNAVNTSLDRIFSQGGLAHSQVREDRVGEISRQLNEQNIGFDIAGTQFGQAERQSALAAMFGAAQNREAMQARMFGEQFAQWQANRQGDLRGLEIARAQQQDEMQRMGLFDQLGMQHLGAATNLSQLPLAFQQFALGLESARANAAIGVGTGYVGAAATAPDLFAKLLDFTASTYGSTVMSAGQAASSSGGAAAMASDKRLKKNIQHVFTREDGVNWYTWEWNDEAKKIGVDDQPTSGVIAQELFRTHPQALSIDDHGYLQVNYGEL